jgi:hypothetical protein
MTTTSDTEISANERRAALTRLDHVRTIEETASLLGIGVPSLRSLLANGEGPQITRLSKRRIGIRDSHREQWLDKQAQPQPA